MALFTLPGISNGVGFGSSAVAQVARSMATDPTAIPRSLEAAVQGSINRLGYGLLGPLYRQFPGIGTSTAVSATLQDNQFVGKLVARPDPLMNFLWRAEIWGNSNTEYLGFEFIEGVQTPSASIETKAVFRQGKMRHYAGAYSADQLTLTIYSDQTGYGVDYINKWQRTIVTENGYFSLPSRYKRNVVVSLLDAKAQTVVTFTFVGCWPTGVESYNLEGGNATVLHTTVQLSCDNVLINATPEVTVSKTTQIPDKQSVVDQGQNFTSSFKGAITTAKDTVNAAKDKINSATSFVNTNIGQFKTSVSSTFKDIFG